MAEIYLSVERGTDAWDELLELLGDDAPDEMRTEDDVEITCDLDYDHFPADRSVGFMEPYNTVNGAYFKGHDLSRFFSDDELHDAANDDQEAQYDAHIDAEIDRMRDERL
jgi:hypothetical protein